MIPQRQKRVSELIKREISNILQKDFQESRLGFTTVTKVDISKDIKHALIWISVMGNEEEKNKSLYVLSHAQGYIKRILASKLRLRYMPTIAFKLDTSMDYDIRIGEILRGLKKEEGWDE